MWDERYSEPGYAYGTTPNDFLVAEAPRLPPGPVLSLGEGEGRNAVFLAERGHELTALDGSAVGLEKARALATSRGVSLHTVHSDIADYSVEPGAWAGIVAIFFHLPRELRARVHPQLVRGLRPGGVLLLESYTPQQLDHRTGGPMQLELLYPPEELAADFAELELLRLESLVREVHEGRFHDGPSAVVQLVARARG